MCVAVDKYPVSAIGGLAQHGDGVPVHGDGGCLRNGVRGRVTLDPLHEYGRPVVRVVPIDVVAESSGPGESTETIADLFRPHGFAQWLATVGSRGIAT